MWENFQTFPHHYKRLKVYWIDEIKGESRNAEKQKRIDYLIKMTRQGKMYGTQPLKS
ncbi:MAG TPA: YdeI/OmpD-associated family protein [Haliscomenobacter sp.]|nr:YdeI/OmpD-associated family protein [Haliscomenobacter sp.]